ncbi:MAG: hypothetical protein HOQ24_06035 [Mycobacteriaceae bacterium]|nr:hypothetical protein [Mycobacteriaceae bacterium]
MTDTAVLQRLVERAHRGKTHPYFAAMDAGAACCALIGLWLGTQWLDGAGWRLPLVAVTVYYFPVYPLVLQAKKKLWGVPARSLLTDTVLILTPVYLACCLASGIPMRPALGYLALALPLAAAAARLGCLLSGCCYGEARTEARWYTVRYTADTQRSAAQWWREFHAGSPNDQPVVAIQAVDFAVHAALFGVNTAVAARFGPQPWTLALYIGAYSLARFVLEFFRGHRHTPRYRLLSHAQIVSAICVVVSAVALYRAATP